MPVSDKYGIVLVQFRAETIGMDEPVAVITAHDALAMKALAFYRSICEKEGCPSLQMDSINKQINNFARWRKNNDGFVRLPGSGV